MPLPLAEVHPPRVPAVRLTDAPRKARRLFRNGNQMNVIGHEVPRKEADPVTLPLLPEKMKVGHSVAIRKEHRHRTNTTFGYVVRNAW